MKPEIKAVHIVQEHIINAPRAKVFAALHQDINSWWSHAAQEDSKVLLDLKLGGQFREEYKDGGGALFATVIWIKAGEGIELMGPMGWDGPVTGTFSYILEERGNATLVKLEHRFFGLLNDEAMGAYTEGWKELLGTDLKDFVEKGKKAR